MNQALKLIILFFLVVYSSEQAISRNKKIQSMLDLLKQNEKIYDTAIKKYEDKIAKEYTTCVDRTKQDQCQNFYIWQQERSKNSKNVTILKQKIAKHNETISAILQLNKLEVTKKNLTMLKIFPQVKKLKDDIELLQSMIFLIEDTYLSLDLPNKSLLSIFSVPIAQEHSNLQVNRQMKNSFLQLMSQQDEKKEEAKAEEKPAADAKPAAETKAPDDNKKVPLVDEELFSGEADQSEAESNVFETAPIADDIPEGVDVPEHDAEGKTAEEIGVADPRVSPESQDLRIYEVREEFKTRVKETGKQMHEYLKKLNEELEKELKGKVQSVLDLEYAIIQLHGKHSKSIVQIYKETKRLQGEIFKIDDVILKLDAKMHDCVSADKAEQMCLQKKNKDQIVVEDLKTEKAFNLGAQKELEKLLKFKDKNVEDPTPQQEPVKPALVTKQEQIISARRAELEQRIQKIKEEEAEVQKEIEKQKDAEQATTLKEAEQQEYKKEESFSARNELINDDQELAIHSLDEVQGKIEEREIDEVLEKVDNELKSEQAEFLLNATKQKNAYIQLTSKEGNRVQSQEFDEQKEREKLLQQNSGQFSFLSKFKNSLR